MHAYRYVFALCFDRHIFLKTLPEYDEEFAPRMLTNANIENIRSDVSGYQAMF